MYTRNLLVLSLFCISIYAQQFPYQPDDFYPRGVCTINGKVYYGIDCWCYSGGLGSTLITIFFVGFIVFFFLSGCIWACIFACIKRIRGDDDDFDGGISSMRASMRTRRAGNDTPI